MHSRFAMTVVGPLKQAELRVDPQRIQDRLQKLAAIGALPGGGVCRLALSDADRQARGLVVDWMCELGLSVSIDAIGNITGLRPGRCSGPPVMTGSHIDSVRSGGIYDGTLGVVAGLEAVEVLNHGGLDTEHSLAVSVFTNEEGVRFTPDMMGSMVHQGHLELATALGARDNAGMTVGAELERIGYRGVADSAVVRPRAYVELHIEQGPVLEHDTIDIGVVEAVQGISWTKVIVDGVANHAGTTPMARRHDAGFAAGAITAFVRGLTKRIGNDQVGTVGMIDLSPNVINVIPERAELTVDLRNTDEERLLAAERELHGFLRRIAEKEGVRITHRQLARFKPVEFDPGMTALIEDHARSLGLSTKRMSSGAGHDAQAFAPNCPTAMIFVPSVGGVSHSVQERTRLEDIENGANVLLKTLRALAG